MVQKAFLAMLLLCTASYAQTPAQFTAQLKVALRHSPLNAAEKVQHVLDRLGYGNHPERSPYRALLKFRPNGTMDEAATDEAIVTYIERSLRPGDYDEASVEGLLRHFPNASLTYAQITEAYKIRARAIKEKELANQDPSALKIELHAFRKSLLEAEQARFLGHAVLSRHPLYLKLLYLWFNRFNVSWDRASADLADYTRTIHRHTHGSFHDLLSATAHHPGMLLYLNNAWNYTKEKKVGPVFEEIVSPNEDYAREVMELHTLGKVAGPGTGPNQYNLEDIHQAARILSGWSVTGATITSPGTRRFMFRAWANPEGTNTVMGQTFKAGEAGGEQFLEFLASHPLTASSVAHMLVKAFVTEAVRTDGIEIYEALQHTFLDTSGDLPSLYRKLFSSNAFWSLMAYRSKAKDPLHLVISLLRGTGREANTLSAGIVTEAALQLRRMNQALFQCSPPTGYPDQSNIWVNTSTIMSFVSYAFKEATYAGDITKYVEAERHARLYSADPARMSRDAILGFLRSYGMSFTPWPFAMPTDSDGNVTMLRYGADPDFRITETSHKALYPVRSNAAAFFGSDQFMKH